MGTNFWAGFAKFFGHTRIELKNGVSVGELLADPTVTGTDGVAGSFCSFGGNLYVKTDAGVSTNWKLLADDAALQAHIVDAVGAHAATAISFNPATSTLVAIEVQAALEEVVGRLDITEPIATEAMILSETNSSTGTLEGGILSVFSGTEFGITDGEGHIVDTHTDPLAPVFARVIWSGFTNVADTGLANDITFIGIQKGVLISGLDYAGVVVQQPGPFTRSQLRDTIQLGITFHNTNLIIGTAQAEMFLGSPMNQMQDLTQMLGTISIGNHYKETTAGTPLQLEKTSGSAFILGGNFTDKKDPNVLTDGGQDAVTLFRSYKDGIGGYTTDTGITSVDPDIYDDASGTPATVPNNKFTIKRLHYNATGDLHILELGQVIYNSLAEAEAALLKGDFEPNPSFSLVPLRSWLIVKKGVTDLAAALLVEEAKFINAGKLGETTAGGTTSATTTLQRAYENSAQPEITLNVDQSTLAINQGAVADSDNIIETQNTLNTVKPFENSVVRTQVTDADGTFVVDKEVNYRHRQNFKDLNFITYGTFTGAVDPQEATGAESPSGAKSFKIDQLGGLSTDYWQSPSMDIDKEEFKVSYNGLEFISKTITAGATILDGDFTIELFANDGVDRSLGLFDIKAGVVDQLFRFDLEDADTTFFYRVYTTTVDIDFSLVLSKIRINLDPRVFATSVEVNSIGLEGNDTRVITVGTENIYYSGSGTGWVSGGALTDNYYEIQFSNSTISLDTQVAFSTNNDRKIDLYKNNVQYRRISGGDTTSYSTRHGSYTSKVGEFSVGDKVSFRLVTNGTTLVNSLTSHYLNIVETKTSTGQVIQGQINVDAINDFNAYVSSLGVLDTTRTAHPDIFTVSKTGTGTYSVAVLKSQFPIEPHVDGSVIDPVELGSMSTSLGQIAKDTDTATEWKYKFISGAVNGGNNTRIDEPFNIYISRAGTDYRDPSEAMYFAPVGDQVENDYTAIIDSAGNILSQGATFLTSTDQLSGVGRQNIFWGTDFFGNDANKISVSATILDVDGTTSSASISNITTSSARIFTEVGGSGSHRKISVTVNRQNGDYREPTALIANAAPIQVAYLKDIRANNVSGGTFTSGAWRVRDLSNKEGYMPSLTLDPVLMRFTLGAGSYGIDTGLIGYKVGAHRAKLYNVTTASYVLLGSSSTSHTSDATESISRITGQIRVTTPSVFEIHHRCTTTRATNGFGTASNFGDDEVYTQVKITKLK